MPRPLAFSLLLAFAVLSPVGVAHADRVASRTSGTLGSDVFSGGPGFDTVDYSSRLCDVTVTIGDGLANDGCSGEGDNVTGDIEHVIGGFGADDISGDGSAELLVGGPGADRLTGMNGDDELRGDDGNDILVGGGNDDHLVGGPGDDQERGEGNNDTFTPVSHAHVEAYPAKPLADRGTTAVTLDVAGLSGTIQDVNVRIDVEHPDTRQLTIILVSPSGTRVGLSRNRGNGTPMRGTVFDSEAVTNIRFANARPFAGRFHPDDSMESFEGQAPNGTWRLEIVDGTTGGSGVLNMWRLQITEPTSGHDGDDVLNGGAGTRDIVDWSGRTQGLNVTMAGGADDGQAGEVDDLGAGGLEDCFGGTGNDVITGTTSANDLRGQVGADEISGLSGPDQIRGRQGADRIFGGDGNDTIQGGTHDDTIDGGAGTDVASYVSGNGGVTVDLGAQTSSGSEGVDFLVGLENVAGTRFADTLRGASNVNSIVAGGGNDSVLGFGGNDRLDGQAGTDRADGGTGTDTCLSSETRVSCEA